MLKFAVCGQALAVMQPVVAADTIDYLEATFMFSSDWDGAVKVAHFRQGNNVYNVSLVDDKIRKEDHLNLSAGRWWVSVHGNVGDSRITTQEKPLVVEKSGVLEGEPLPDLPLTTAEKLTNEVAALREDVPDPEGVAEDWVLTPGGWQPQKDGLGLPTPTAEDAGKVPVVKEDGSGYALGNKVELIKSITIGDDAEEANALTIDADEDGNPFELVYARLQSYFPKYTGTSEIPKYSYTMVNGYTYGSIYPAVYTSGFPVVSNAQPRSSIYVMDTRGPQLYEYGFRVNTSSEIFGGHHSDSRMFYRGPENLEYFSPITSIGGTNMLIYPGCKFELWGVRR